MYVALSNFFTFILCLFILLGIIGGFQENLKKLFFYTIISQAAYISVMIYHIITLNELELLIISCFYLIVSIITYLPFFMCVLYMKRGGDTYKVKSIYDLAQLWVTDRKVTVCFLILLAFISGIPFFPGFMCKWFFVEEIFFFQKYLGVLSFFMSIIITIPYIRIINQMIFNKTLMHNPKGPRWYFDKILSNQQLFILAISTALCVLFSLNPSVLWYLSYYVVKLYSKFDFF